MAKGAKDRLTRTIINRGGLRTDRDFDRQKDSVMGRTSRFPNPVGRKEQFGDGFGLIDRMLRIFGRSPPVIHTIIKLLPFDLIRFMAIRKEKNRARVSRDLVLLSREDP